MRRAALVFLALALAACSAPPEPPTFELERPILSEDGKLEDGEELAHELYAAGRYEEARQSYQLLSVRTEVPKRRAEFSFLTGECSLGLDDLYDAYLSYSRLLQLYPNTDRYATAVDRVFHIGKYFAEGRATKSSWLFGIDMTDQEFGVQVLERFQKVREQHELADDALHFIALAQVDLEEPDLAIEAWTKLTRLYPDRDLADTADYRIGLTLLLLSDGVEYDKGPMLAGLLHLKRYAERDEANHREEAEAKVKELEEQLASQKLELARFYLRRDKNYAATLYLDSIEREFPATEAADLARELKKSIPQSSAPEPPPDPEDLEVDEDEPDHLRLAPVPIDEAEKPSGAKSE